MNLLRRFRDEDEDEDHEDEHVDDGALLAEQTVESTREALMRVRTEAVGLVHEWAEAARTRLGSVVLERSDSVSSATPSNLPSPVFGERNLGSPVFFRDDPAHVDRPTITALPPALEALSIAHVDAILGIRSSSSASASAFPETDAVIPTPLVDELELLVRMLFIDVAAASTSTPFKTTTTHNTLVDAETAPRYAAAVLSKLPLTSLGPQLCEQLSRLAPLQRWAPDMARACARRAATSAAPSTHHATRGGNKAATPVYQLPFRQDTDSRNHFSGAEQKAIFDSREKLRDVVGGALRSVLASRRGIAPPPSAGASSPLQIVRAAALECMQTLQARPANAFWLAHLIIAQLLKVSHEGDTELDQDVKRLAGAERLSKLSRRMLSSAATSLSVTPAAAVAGSSPGPAAPGSPSPGPHNAWGLPRSFSARGMSHSSSFSMPPPGATTLSALAPSWIPPPVPFANAAPPTSLLIPDPRLESRMNSAMAGGHAPPTSTLPADAGEDDSSTSLIDTLLSPDLFSDLGERFFLALVRATDSHALCANVTSVATAELARLSAPFSEANPVPTHDAWAERLSASRTLARLWGYLYVFPRFASSKAAHENRASSAAFRAQFDELVAMEDREASSRSLPWEARSLVDRAAEHGTLVVVVPWVCELTRVLLRDPVLRETKALRLLMSRLLEARMSHALGIGRGYGAVRAAADVDALLSEAAAVWDLDVVSLAAAVRPPPKRVTAEALARVQGQPDSLPDLFDACDLDRRATSSVLLTRFRSVLVSMLRPTGPVLALQPRKVLSVRLQDVGGRTLERDAAWLALSSSSLLGALGASAESSSSVSAAAQGGAGGVGVGGGGDDAETVRESLESLFLRHDEDISRAVDFALAVVPKNTCEAVLTKALVEARAEMEIHVASAGRAAVLSGAASVERLRHKTLVAAMSKAYHEMERPIEAIVEAACPHRDAAARRAAVDVALRRADARMERMLRAAILDAVREDDEVLVRLRALPPPAQPANAQEANPPVTNVLTARRVALVSSSSSSLSISGEPAASKTLPASSARARLVSLVSSYGSRVLLVGESETSDVVTQLREAFSAGLTSSAAGIRGLPKTDAGFAARAVQAVDHNDDRAMDDVRRNPRDAVRCASWLVFLARVGPPGKEGARSRARRVAMGMLRIAAEEAATRALPPSHPWALGAHVDDYVPFESPEAWDAWDAVRRAMEDVQSL